jgi:hypothetical protein
LTHPARRLGWAADDPSRGNVYRIDPATNRVVAGTHIGGVLKGLVALDGAVWVTRVEPSGLPTGLQLYRIDPLTNNAARAGYPADPRPDPIMYAKGSAEVVGFGGDWAVDQDAVVRFTVPPSPGVAGAVVATIPVDRAARLAIGLGGVWVLTEPLSASPNLNLPITGYLGGVFLIDPRTNAVAGEPVFVGYVPASMAVGDGAVWVGEYDSAVLTRIELQPGDAIPPIPSASPSTIVLNPDRIWFDPPGDAHPPLTSSDAMATFEAANPEFHPAAEPTAQLGFYTAAVGDGYRYKHRLAWGFTWHQCAPQYRNPPSNAVVSPRGRPYSVARTGPSS